MCVRVLKGTNNAAVEIPQQQKYFTVVAVLWSCKTALVSSEKQNTHSSKCFWFLRQKSDRGEIEYQNKSYVTAEVPACAFPLTDLCCISLVPFSSGMWGHSQIYSQNCQQWIQSNSLLEGIIHSIPTTPGSSFLAIGLVILREAVSRKQSVADFWKGNADHRRHLYHLHALLK